MSILAGVKSLSRQVLGLGIFLIFWELLALSGVAPADYLPRLSVIFTALIDYLSSSNFYFHLGITLRRMLIGFSIAVALSLSIAILTGRYPIFLQMLAPLVEMLRALPPPALVPLLVFILGIGDALFYFVVVFGCMWPVYVNATNAFSTAEPVQVHTARSFGYSEWEILLRVRLPAAVPEIMTGVRQSAAISLLASVATEMLVGDKGLGYLLFNAGFSLLIAQMYALIFVVGIIGMLINPMLGLINRGIAGWQIELSATGDAS